MATMTDAAREMMKAADAIKALATREERRECDDCGFKGTSDDASKEQDYCTACGGNSPAGGPDECAHCGAKNHMVMACPKCGGRFSLDEGGQREAPAGAGAIYGVPAHLSSEAAYGWSCGYEAALRAQPQAREDAQPVGHFQHSATWSAWEEVSPEYAGSEGVVPLYRHPAPDALRVAVEALGRSPAIEELTPTNREWVECVSVQDRYDLMKRRLGQALAALQAEQGTK